MLGLYKILIEDTNLVMISVLFLFKHSLNYSLKYSTLATVINRMGRGVDLCSPTKSACKQSVKF